jgi:DNA repair protein RecO (recombination protein O)
MPTFKTPALVLRAYDFSEADRILVLFTQHHGKIKGVAKGVRKTASRLKACLGWLTRAELQLAGRDHQDLYRIIQGQLLESYPRLKGSLDALGAAARMAELLFALTPDQQPLPEIYELAETALSLWDAGADSTLVGIWFEWMFLERMGHRPRVEACRHCGANAEVLAYHAEHEDTFCRACRPKGGYALSAGARKALSKILSGHPALLPRLRLPADAEIQIQALLDEVIRRHLGRPLKSESFHQAVKRLK